jgi:hypothetical protein
MRTAFLRRASVVLCVSAVLAPAADAGRLYGRNTLRYPEGTKAKASFATPADNGPDRLIDGRDDTYLIGEAGTARPDAPVHVDIVFGRPVEGLAGVATGGSDPLQNYYPVLADFLVDTTGNGEFDTAALRGVKLGPGRRCAGEHRFEKPIPKAFALRMLVTEQSVKGARRAFRLDELSLLSGPPAGGAPPPQTPREVRVPEAGDRGLPMRIVYPPGAMRENGGTVIDLTRPPFDAKGDGRTDDTEAFIRALDFVADETRKAREKSGGRLTWILYLPKGRYLVSDTLAARLPAGPGGFCYFRLVGEDRRETVIRLKDGAPGFGDPARPKTVLPWEGREPGQGNILWGNQARNFTVDTGSGNPGAVAMTFMGANASSMDNITLRSGDGRGRVGLHLNHWSVQGHYSDITVDGFDVGIRGDDARETQPTLEYVTLSGQREAGIRVGPHAASIRRLLTRGRAPAVVVDHRGSQTIIVDSRLEGGPGAEGPAIRAEDSAKGAQLFVRNVAVTGHPVSIRAFGDEVRGDVSEYVSGPVVRLRPDAPTRSMALPVEEVKYVPWEADPAKWASPDDYPGDDAARLQAALNSGKPAVFLPRRLDLPDPKLRFRIPATVRQIDFMHHPHRLWGVFLIAERSDTPLWIEHCGNKPNFHQTAPRELHFRYGSARYQAHLAEPVTVHFQSMAVLAGAHDPRFCPPNVRIYARSINEEIRDVPNFTVKGGMMWVLGFKTEHRQPAFTVEDGGFLEVLGGYQNMTAFADRETCFPIVINGGGNVSVSATTHMARKYPEAIRQIRGDLRTSVANDELPRRDVGSPAANYVIPLYLDYDPDALKRLSARLAAPAAPAAPAGR